MQANDPKVPQNPNDPFNRQRNISGWDQKKFQDSKILCLGVGGLGSVVVMHLLRLGVGELYLVDNDKVEITNLNRQIMFTFEDIGAFKVDAAIKNSKFHNVGNTKIEGYNIDAVKNFGKIVELAKKSTFVFNMIDYGDEWDLAIQSLCLKLRLPHVVGGNFCKQFSIDFWTPEGKPCLNCGNSKNKDGIERITPDKILDIKDLSFLPKEVHPVSQSYAVLCTMTGIAEVNQFTNYILDNTTRQVRSISYTNDLETLVFKVEPRNDCIFCGQTTESVPLSSQQTESTIVNLPIGELWAKIKSLRLDRMFPQKIKSVKYLTGGEGEVGSQIEIEFQDKCKWIYLLSEISETYHRISYEVISSDSPAYVVSEVQTFELFAVTDLNQTYLQWLTYFASDINLSVYYHSKFFKQECFKELNAKTVLG